jgi:hypothetical protein
MVFVVSNGISGSGWEVLDAQHRPLQGSTLFGSSGERAYRTKVKSDRSLRCIRRIVLLPCVIDGVTFSAPFSCSRRQVIHFLTIASTNSSIPTRREARTVHWSLQCSIVPPGCLWNNAISHRKINVKYAWSSKTLTPEPGSGHREGWNFQ